MSTTTRVHYLQKGSIVRRAQGIALKLRATRPPAQDCGTIVCTRQRHNTPLPLKRSPPGSFKRLLGCAPGEGSSQSFRRMIELCIHIAVRLGLREVVCLTNSETKFIIVNPEFNSGALEV